MVIGLTRSLLSMLKSYDLSDIMGLVPETIINSQPANWMPKKLTRIPARWVQAIIPPLKFFYILKVHEKAEKANFLAFTIDWIDDDVCSQTRGLRVRQYASRVI